MSCSNVWSRLNLQLKHGLDLVTLFVSQEIRMRCAIEQSTTVTEKSRKNLSRPWVRDQETTMNKYYGSSQPLIKIFKKMMIKVPNYELENSS